MTKPGACKCGARSLAQHQRNVLVGRSAAHVYSGPYVANT